LENQIVYDPANFKEDGKKGNILCPNLACCGVMKEKTNPEKFYLECDRCDEQVHSFKEWFSRKDEFSDIFWEKTLESISNL